MASAETQIRNVLNNAEGFNILKKYSDLIIGKWYLVPSLEMKKISYGSGKRVQLTMCDIVNS